MSDKSKKSPTKKPSPSSRPKPTNGECFNCKKAVTGDDFCYGCNAHVCQECNVAGLFIPFGGHTRDDHMKRYDDEGEEDLSDDDDE